MRKTKFYLASKITEKQRSEIQAAGLAYFPELFGDSNAKYSQFVIWMAAQYRVVSPSTRDLFTAGGRRDLYIGGIRYQKVPHILICAYENRKAIVKTILNAPESTLKCYWGVRTIREDRLAQWIELVYEQSSIGGIKYILEGMVKNALKEIAQDEQLEQAKKEAFENM